MDLGRSITVMKLTVKNLKKMEGRGGYVWSCDLYIDGVKAAHVLDEGYGGMVDFHWYRKELESPFLDYIKTLPKRNGHEETPALFVAALCDEAEEQKTLKRWCKTKTVIRMKDAEEGKFTMFKTRFSPMVKEALLKKYGDRIVEFVNETVAES